MDGPRVAVGASCTGQGDLSKYGSHSRYTSSGRKYNSRSQGTYRDAVASAQVGNTNLGSWLWARMYNNKWSDV